MFTFEMDEKTRTITVEIHGIMSESEADGYTVALDQKFIEVFRRFGRIKFLVDARQSCVQPAAVANKMQMAVKALRTSDDRFAVVVPTGLMRMQAARVTDDARAKVFTSIDDARTWLDGCDVNGAKLSHHGMSTAFTQRAE